MVLLSKNITLKLTAFLGMAMSFSALGNTLYCPQKILCQVNSQNNITSCSPLPSGWAVSATSTNGVKFKPGEYTMRFSAAQSYASSANCNYAVTSQDTNGAMVAVLSNNTWTAKPKSENNNQWKAAGYGYYCFAEGLWYDKINDASACPFVERAH